MVPQPITCAICGKTFKKQGYLKDHMLIHSGVRPYKCFHCDKDFLLKYQAKRHMMSHSQNTIAYIKCDAEGCPKKFKLERTMKKHYENTHVFYKCTFEGCDMIFRKKKMLKMHFEKHFPTYLHCTYEGCTSVFINKRNFQRHLENHEKVFQCGILGCGVSVKSWTAYRKHVKSHQYVHCKECGVVCPNTTTFKKHCKEAHPPPKKPKKPKKPKAPKPKPVEARPPPPEPKPPPPPKLPKPPKEPVEVVCPYENCGKTYCKGSNLNKHIRVIHKSERFHCSIEGCNRSFAYKCSLKNHLIAHEKPQTKKTKKKRKRKSLAAKLSRYNGELCDLPVTYVDSSEEKTQKSDEEVSGDDCDVSRATTPFEEATKVTVDGCQENSLFHLNDSSTNNLNLVAQDSQLQFDVFYPCGNSSFSMSTNEQKLPLECPVSS